MESDKKDKVFANGMMYKLPHPNSPAWVKGSISIKVTDFIAFLQTHQSDGWCNLDMKKSKEKGTIYFELNTWKPASKEETKGLGEGVKSEEINTAGF